jgi:hypothetical protein
VNFASPLDFFTIKQITVNDDSTFLGSGFFPCGKSKQLTAFFTLFVTVSVYFTLIFRLWEGSTMDKQ